jgi:methionine aminopeptidase
MREMDRLSNDVYRDVRLAAEVHRQVRQYAQGIIKPGARLIDICEQLEDMNRKLVKARNATQRNATQRNATQRNATQRNATRATHARHARY